MGVPSIQSPPQPNTIGFKKIFFKLLKENTWLSLTSSWVGFVWPLTRPPKYNLEMMDLDQI